MKFKATIPLCAALMLGTLSVPAVRAGEPASYRWQMSQLQSIATAPRQNEFRILIVDRVKDKDVNKFMNTRFDMIDRVMFTNVMITDKYGNPRRDKKTGAYLTEEDGC